MTVRTWVGELLPQVPAGLARAPSGRDPRTNGAKPGKSKRIVAANFIPATVDRLDVDPFVGLRDQLSLKRGSGQELVDHGSPLVVVDRRKIILNREFVRKRFVIVLSFGFSNFFPDLVPLHSY